MKDASNSYRKHIIYGCQTDAIKKTITGRQEVNYKLGAKAGQSMVVILNTDNASNYFNIYAPGKGPGDEALFVAAMNGSRYEGVLQADGEYTVQVFLMRNAARRNEKANYTLEVEIKGTAKTSSSGTRAINQPVDTSGVKWPSNTDASGDLPCSAGEPGFKRSCAFRVKRNTYGATIWTIKPGTNDALRVLYFENKAFSSDDDAELSWKRQDDNWRVSAGKKEIYLIPDAVIFGG
ncbi:MAG: hypothetical protein DRR42_28060 [Gammaproteobacteria bacterium]|nr:MAG: hypothetical protein DRR42_28060 [Gammaproteobacteria bacterium]